MTTINNFFLLCPKRIESQCGENRRVDMKAFGAAPLLLTLAKVLAIQGVSFYYDVDKYRFVSYRNVWHDDVGNHLSYSVDGGINEDLARAGCANFCAVDSNCDAFYLEEKPGIGNCHLVDETGFPRTVGHGWASNKVHLYTADCS